MLASCPCARDARRSLRALAARVFVPSDRRVGVLPSARQIELPLQLHVDQPHVRIARPRAGGILRGEFLECRQGFVRLVRLGVKHARVVESLGHMATGRIATRQVRPIGQGGGAGGHQRLFLLLPVCLGHPRRGGLLWRRSSYPHSCSVAAGPNCSAATRSISRANSRNVSSCHEPLGYSLRLAS